MTKINEFAWENLPRPILALAPMAGVTDSPFRQICREAGADVVYSEMISVTGLFHRSPKTSRLFKFTPREHPLIIQVFGAIPEHFAYAAKYLTEQVRPAGIDINFGCPVRDVINTGAGCYLMKNPALAKEVLSAVRENTSLPVSIKTRTQVGEMTVLDLLEAIKTIPLQALMVHGRSFSQKFSGAINIEMIKEAKKMFKGIVLANGNMNTPEQVGEVLSQTGCDGVGLARGILGKPYLFTQVKELLATGQYTKPLFSAVVQTILKQAQLMQKEKGDHGIIEMRKHLGWYVHDFPGAKNLRNQLYRCLTYKEMTEILLENSRRFG
ncbi:MAG: tRNA-dihydrouridine synthase [bacterium]|jgi:tRNA-dihydrouridine synthase B|nr:tRNA-dihydrouridine synthase [bacterium]